MKIKAGVVVCGFLLLGLSIVANAQSQSAGTPSGPIQWISNSEFNQMVQAGQLKLDTPVVLVAQDQQVRAKYLRNLSVVEDFLQRNPGLTRLAHLVAITPGPDDKNVTVNSSGDYDVVIDTKVGVPDFVQTMGQRTKVGQLANSMVTSTDPAAQLEIYSSLYKSLPAAFLNSATPPIVPSQLQGASLATVKNALDAVVSQYATIARLVPPIQIIAEGCSAELGASVSESDLYYGDQSTLLSAGYGALSPTGIVANFDFSSKSLLTCIKEQGLRGTCGIFAAVSGMEEVIARDTGVLVNLSEQDFWENVKLNFDPDYYGDGEDPGYALYVSANNGYQFAYENQWDYNPSWSQPNCPGCYEYVNTCDNYPAFEAGCSDSAPQAPEYCTFESHRGICGFFTALLPGIRAPYGAPSTINIWNPGSFCFGCAPGVAPDPDLTVKEMITNLALNNAVILGFNLTNDFGNPPGGYVWGGLTPKERNADAATSVGGHNVHVVGYVSNIDLAAKVPSAPPGPGGGYFVIKNSWGLHSGDAGYYYMPVEYLKKEAQAVYVISSVPSIE
jgi:C1A family cysteine protease